MSNLITESISEKPLVLIVGEESLLTNAFKKLFVDNDLAVFQITTSDFEQKSFLNFVKSKTSLYKIYWFVGFTDEKDFERNAEVFNAFKQLEDYYYNSLSQHAPLSIIFQFDSEVKAEVEIYTKYFTRLKNKKNLLNNILQELPQSQLFVGQDILGEYENPLYPLLYFLGCLDQKKIITPNQEVFYQTSDDFFSTISSMLLKPHSSNKYLVKGKTTSCKQITGIISELYKKYFNQELVEISINSINNNNFFSNIQFIEVRSTDKGIVDYFDGFVRRIPMIVFKTSLQKTSEGDLFIKKHSLNYSNDSKTSLSYPPPEFPIDKKKLGNLSNYRLKQIDDNTEKIEKRTNDLPRFSDLVLKVNKNTTQPIEEIESIKNSYFIEKKIDKTLVSQPKVDSSSEISLKIGGVNKIKSEIKDKKEGDNSDDLDKDLQKLFGDSREDSKESRIVEKNKKKKKIVKKSKRKKTMFFGGVGVIALGLVFISFFLFYQLSNVLFKKEIFSFMGGYSNTSSQLVEEEQKQPFTSFWKKALEKQGLIYGKFVNDEVLGDSKDYMALALKIDQLIKSKKTFQKTQIIVYKEIFGGGGVSDALISNLSNQSQILYETLSQIQGELKKLTTQALSQENKLIIEEFSQKILEDRQKKSYYSQIKSFLSIFFGNNQKKVYAVLLQNNLELRPTGGFIQAVALLTFDQGMLIDSQVMSVYEIDDKLMSEVVPPEEMKKVLGENRWYLRDSNWDPDFVTTSESVAWFLKESLGVSVDGVVAIDFNVIKDVLESSGDLSIPEHNEVLTSKNIFERMEYHSKDDLNKENGQQQDYYSLVFNKLINQLQNLSEEKIIPTISAFRKSLDEKNMLISFVNKDERPVLNELGWDGQLIQPNCPTQLMGDDCFVDYIYQVEANSGVNKVNAYIHRKIDHKVIFNDDGVRHERKIVYKNSSKTDIWPQGTYRTYIRFYTHDGSVLEKVLLNDREVDIGLITNYKTINRNVFGVLLEVPKNQETSLQIIYSQKITHDNKNIETISDKKQQNNMTSYVFFDQKQPGWINDSLSLTLVNNSNMNIKTIAPQAKIEDNVINFEVNRNEHAFIGIGF